jgi:hypothetical protein
MAEEMRKGLGKMGGKMPDERKGSTKPMEHGKMGGESQPDEKTTTITHHADGTHSMEHDGEHSDHPHHMHLMAHLGHKLTGGDAHHVVHHDGMEAHSHMVGEDGEHQDHEGDPHQSLDAMMGGGMQDEGVEGDQQMMEHPTYGGM